MKKALLRSTCVGILLTTPAAFAANIQVTEWMYSGSGGEFIEFTNMGSSAVDFTGWRYDDDSASYALGFDLSGFGVVGVGESVIITESSAASFSSSWNLASSVKVLGGYTNNIGRADAINLFDASQTLVDSFAYGDQVYAGTVRTLEKSGTPNSLAALTSSTVTSSWVFSATGDAFGSYANAGGAIGNPGSFAFAPAPIPEPSTYLLMGAGLALFGSIARRRIGR